MERVDADLVPFAKNNPSGYRFAFGTDTATDDINVNYNDNIKKGWGTTPNEFPEVEDFNAFAYTSGYLTSYLYQMGISEWNNKQKYRQYSRVTGSNGKIYKAKTGTDLAPNVNQNPTADSVNWELDNQFEINSLTAKTTPNDTDNLVVQETEGLLKKLTFANLKNWILSLFQPTLTGTATFTATDNKIVMNGIASALGLEIGDVIQFTSGTNATNAKMRTVESITNDNEIIVNYEHSGARGNGSLKLSDQSSITCTVKRIAKYYDCDITLGRDWVTLSSTLRPFAVNQTNTTGRAMLCQTSGSAIANGSIYMLVYLNDILTKYSISGSVLAGNADSVEYTIPPTVSYKVTAGIPNTGNLGSREYR